MLERPGFCEKGIKLELEYATLGTTRDVYLFEHLDTNKTFNTAVMLHIFVPRT